MPRTPNPEEVFVAVPTIGKTINMDLSNLLTAWSSIGVPNIIHPDPNGGYLDVMRASMCKRFLEDTKARYFLMIDADVVPPINAWYALAYHDKPVIGAPVSVLKGSGFVWNFVHEDAHGVPRFPELKKFEKPNGPGVPGSGVLQVRVLGSGVIMIRRDVLESFSYDENVRLECGSLDFPFFIPEQTRAESAIKGDMSITTDYQFCRQVYEHGHSVWVDLSMSAAHHKNQGIRISPQCEGGDDWKLPETCHRLDGRWDPWPEGSRNGTLIAAGKEG